LIATNFFGQNTPAIMATEAHYMEMWAQDAATMYGYSASSAVASALAPFTTPPNTTTPEATTDQALMQTEANATPAGNAAQNVAAITPQIASTTAAPAAQAPAAATTGPFTWLQNLLNGLATDGLPTPTSPWWGVQPSAYNAILKQTTGLAYFSNGMASFGMSIGQQTFNGPLGTTAGSAGAFIPTPQFATLGAGGWSFHPASLPTASLSSATKIGGLSVPQTWANATGAEEQAATKLVSTNLVGTPEGANAAGANAAGTNAAMRGVPLMGGRGAQRAGNMGVRYGFRYNVLTRPPSAG